MDTQTIWMVVAAAATPIAGVVGFSVQLRQVKKFRLENEKLQLEIAELKARAAKSNSVIVKPTTDEVILLTRHSRIQRSIPDDFSDLPDNKNRKIPDQRISFADASVAAGLLFMAAYFLYDIYRFATWIFSKF